MADTPLSPRSNTSSSLQDRPKCRFSRSAMPVVCRAPGLSTPYIPSSRFAVGYLIVGRALRQRRSGKQEGAPALRHSREAAGPTNAGGDGEWEVQRVQILGDAPADGVTSLTGRGRFCFLTGGVVGAKMAPKKMLPHQ